MYEKMRNEIIMRLLSSGSVTDEQIGNVMKEIDIAASGYEVTKKSTAIVPFGEDIPKPVQMYLVSKSVEGLSKLTLKGIGYRFKIFFRAVGKDLSEISQNDIRAYLYRYQIERKVKDNTLNKVRQELSGLFCWLYDEDYIKKNPMRMIKPIRCEVKERQPLNQIELEYMRKACLTKKEKAILEVLYSTGCRISELFGLKKEDLDLDHKTVHLFGKGKKHRTSFINAKAEVAIRDYLSERNDRSSYLFVSDRRPYNQMHPGGMQKIIKQIAKRTIITKRVTPHVLRHSTATQALYSGMPVEEVQKLLGHSNVSTTMIYVHTNMDQVHNDHIRCVV